MSLTNLDLLLHPSVFWFLVAAFVVGSWTLVLIVRAVRQKIRCWRVRRELARLQAEGRLYLFHPPGPSVADKRAALAELGMIVDELLITSSARESRRIH